MGEIADKFSLAKERIRYRHIWGTKAVMGFKKKIAFIGLGNMGQALARGILERGIVEPSSIVVSDIDKDKLQSCQSELQLTVAGDNKEAVRKADIIIIAVKPKSVESVLKEVAGSLEPSKLVISIAAGVTTGYIENILRKEVAVVRVMPNTAVLVGDGMSAIARGKFVGEEEEKISREIFSAVGKVVEVKEELMNAVTSLSGSGPAYIFAVMENLIEAGVREGLSPQLADTLVKQTALGAVRMASQAKEKLSTLREMVTSPGGTTEAALNVFKEKGLQDIMAEAVASATRRAKELQE
ncbi:pyrroline-5-carboxylate reductase [bacterium]|nr:pyrroline-5-carboxylate reductase [bacterium]